jgi:predicted dehydrogenase/nucleoside-diphosphate-sugar epimerase
MGHNEMRIGVIGCGAISEIYHLPALVANPLTREGFALAEPNEKRLQQVKNRFAAKVACKDYRDLIAHVDAVIIATPPQLHYPMTKFFLEHRIPVLCEKPMTELASEARELVLLSEANHTPLLVNQTRRFFPTYQKIRQIIAAGELGRIESISYHDGVDFEWPAASPHHFKPEAKGAWLDTGVHLLDSVCYWLNAQPKLVQSMNDACGGPEALTTVTLDHAGCQIELKISRLGRLSNSFSIVGSLGSIDAESEDWDEITIRYNDGRKRRFKCASNKLKYPDFAKPMLQNFVDVIRKKADPIASGRSVLGTIELLEQAYEQAQVYPQPWNEHLIDWAQRDCFRQVSQQATQRVLVTGVSGFVGGRVVEAMAISGLFQPVCAVRNWSRCARVATRPVEIVACDIMDRDQVFSAVGKVDAIVHCAYTDDRATIVEGSRNVLDAAARQKISNFVYLSSAEVYGADRVGEVTEVVQLAASGRSYGDAKLEVEGLCERYAAQGVRATILRPALIYGPYGASWSIGVADRLQSGQWGIFEGFGEGYANLIYIDDLIQAIFLALQTPATAPRRFNVNGPETPTWNQYFGKMNHALGLPELQPISSVKSRRTAWFTDTVRGITSSIKARFEEQLMEIYLRGGRASQLMKKLKSHLQNTPSADELNDLFNRKAIYKDDAIRNELGYHPDFNLDAGIAHTLHWMLLHELIRDPTKVASEKTLPALALKPARGLA